jgi:hydroxylysine kinase
MTRLLDDLVEPFERADPAVVTELLQDAWGVDIHQLTLLDTERDDTFRVNHADGVLLAKVAHPNDSAALLDLQDRALDAVAANDPDLPVPRVVPALNGQPLTLDGRVVRVLTWMPGTPTSRARLPLRAAGEHLGRLNRALAPLEHPAADRVLPWDLRHVPELAGYIDDPFVVAVIDRFASEIAPQLAALPRQLVHSDFHPGNVLTDDDDIITGVIDFGDLVNTPRVCDVGVALGYLVPDDGPVDALHAAFLAGFESIVPLTDDERGLLPGLVVGRQLQRIVINDELGRRTGERANPERLRRSLDRALEGWP